MQTGKASTRKNELLLKTMLAEARRHHGGDSEAKQAVLLAWVMLRSRKLWTDEMAAAVRRITAAAVLLVAVAIAGRAATVVTESAVRASGGTRATGTITVRPYVPFVAASGVVVVGDTAVPVINGKFSVSLEPGVYRARWQLDDAAPLDQFWVVPASGSVATCAVVSTRVNGAWVTPGCGGTLRWSTLTSPEWTALTAGPWGGLTQ